MPDDALLDDAVLRERVMNGCKWEPRHLPVVTSRRRLRDFFRLTCWLRCWECDLEIGPLDRREADKLWKRVEAL